MAPIEFSKSPMTTSPVNPKRSLDDMVPEILQKSDDHCGRVHFAEDHKHRLGHCQHASCAPKIARAAVPGGMGSEADKFVRSFKEARCG
jgi:hypothetical protein